MCNRRSARQLTPPTILLVFLLAVFGAQTLFAQPTPDGELHSLTRQLKEWSGAATGWQEGFHHALSGQTISYHSSFPAVSEALISRASDGTMQVTWETDPVSIGDSDDQVTVVWTAGLGINVGQNKFELTIDGAHALAFETWPEQDWEVVGDGGVRLRFQSTKMDAARDVFGIMWLEIPTDLLTDGQPVEISVRGHEEGSQAWFMVFAYPETVDTIRRSSLGFWFELSWPDDLGDARLTSTSDLIGRRLTLQIPDEEDLDLVMNPVDGVSEAQLDPRTMQSLLSKGEVVLSGYRSEDKTESVSFTLGEGQQISLRPGGVVTLVDHSRIGDLNVVNVSGTVVLPLADRLGLVQKSRFSDGILGLITSSHQDIAWMETPERCIALRDSAVLTPAFALLSEDSTYHYSVEQALMLREYLERHPDSLAALRRFTDEGRIEWGATYNQPYEGMYPGESLARQLYFGRKWLMQILPGYDPRVAWNVDVPGRTLQMPQILAKAGVDYLVMSRFREGFFWWDSPDGSRIGAFSPGHYHGATDYMRRSLPEMLTGITGTLQHWEDVMESTRLPAALPLLVSSDMSGPRDYRSTLRAWNALESRDDGATQTAPGAFPNLGYSTMEKMLDGLFRPDLDLNLPVLVGERPNVWLYIHGPTHHKALTALREAGRLLPAAETVSALGLLADNAYDRYPAERLSEAWEAHIFPDHGWGGKNGHVTDSVFADSEFTARSESEAILENGLVALARHVSADFDKGIPIVVYNGLTWNRSEEVTVEYPQTLIEGNPEIFSADGQRVPSRSGTAHLPDGDDQPSRALTFLAKDVPGIGYSTYYVQSGTEGSDRMKSSKPFEQTWHNAHYEVEFAPGGIRQVTDMESGRPLFNTDKFLAGELFVLRSVGNGAGEFAEVQQPDPNILERMSDHSPAWTMVSDDTMATVFGLSQQLEHAEAELRLTVHHFTKRLDFDLDLLDWDGTQSLEFRMAFPVSMTNAGVSYEVPYGRVRVGIDELEHPAGERYVQPVAEIHPREVVDWMAVKDESFSITWKSDVSVFDYVDPTENPVNYPVIQPVLLASRKSCHWEGNWYLQPGDHRYSFSLTSGAPDEGASWRFGKAAANPLRGVITTQNEQSGDWPQISRLVGIEHQNILLSTLKMAEDGEALVGRLYETEGRSTDVTLRLFKPIKAAWLTNLIEESVAELRVTDGSVMVPMGAYGIETIRLEF